MEKKMPTYEEFMEMLVASQVAAEKIATTERKAAEERAAVERKAAEERAAEYKRRDEAADKRMEKLEKEIFGISQNIGHHAEQYFQNALAKNKVFGGEKYDKIIKNLKFEGKESCEFDIFLVNGKSVAIIEAKARIHPNFVEEMALKKVKQFRKNFPEYKDYKLHLGIAGFSFDDVVVKEAKKYGVGIITQAGKSIQIDDSELKVY